MSAKAAIRREVAETLSRYKDCSLAFGIAHEELKAVRKELHGLLEMGMTPQEINAVVGAMEEIRWPQ